MNKYELESGMIITLRNGEEYVVLTDTCFDGDIIAVNLESGKWMNLSNSWYDAELKYAVGSLGLGRKYDVVSVVKPDNPSLIVPSIYKKYKEEQEEQIKKEIEKFNNARKPVRESSWWSEEPEEE